MIQHSLQAWATSLGMERRTLETRLVKAGFSVPKKDGNGVSAKKVFVALLGEADAEKNRLTSAQAQKVERENAEAGGVIQSRELVEAELWNNGLAKVRDELLDWSNSAGMKIKVMLESAGCNSDVIKRVIETGEDGVRQPLEKMNAVLKKSK